MGTEHKKPCLNDENVESPSVPPGFVSLTSFIVKRVEKSEESNNSQSFMSASKQEPIITDTMSDITDIAELKRSVKRRPWMLFNQSNHRLEESESEQFDMVIDPLPVLEMLGFVSLKNYSTLWF